LRERPERERDKGETEGERGNIKTKKNKKMCYNKLSYSKMDKYALFCTFIIVKSIKLLHFKVFTYGR
jgi:hypothetical protein